MKVIHLNKAEATTLAMAFALSQDCETEREMFDKISEAGLSDFFEVLREQYGYAWRHDRKLFIKSV